MLECVCVCACVSKSFLLVSFFGLVFINSMRIAVQKAKPWKCLINCKYRERDREKENDTRRMQKPKNTINYKYAKTADFEKRRAKGNVLRVQDRQRGREKWDFARSKLSSDFSRISCNKLCFLRRCHNKKKKKTGGIVVTLAKLVPVGYVRPLFYAPHDKQTNKQTTHSVSASEAKLVKYPAKTWPHCA